MNHNFSIFSADKTFARGIAELKEAVTELRKLDRILTEIGKTSDLTKRQLKELGNTAFDTASKYGKSAADYLTGIQEMYRAGFDNAKELAELSLLAQAAGDIEADCANRYLTAANAAYDFKGNAEELNGVLDSQTYIANRASVRMEDMADATSEAAFAAAQYGVGIDELSALIAVAASKMADSGVEIGGSIKRILEALQDTSNVSVAEALDSVGISMTKLADGSLRLKTPIELLKELSAALCRLPEGDAARTDIFAAIGGENHADTLSALLSDWSSYEALLALYPQGAGSAAKAAEESAATVDSSLQRLRNTWTDTVENVINSDAIRAAADACNGLLSVVNHMTEKLGQLKTVGLGAGLLAGIKNVGSPKMSGLTLF